MRCTPTAISRLSRQREEEAVGIVAGAWMGGTRGILLMQTSGFATLANVLASLPVAFQIPVLLMISERGVLGEFNLGQAMVNRTMRPVLDSLAMVNHTITRLDELEFILDRSIAAEATRDRAGRRRLAANASRLARHHRDAQAEEPRDRRD